MKLIDFIADDNTDVRVRLTVLNMLNNNTTTIRELAASVYLQEDYLKRIFRRYTGTGLYQFYNWIKLLKAISKIQNNDKIKKIAIELGYSSSSSLIILLRKSLVLAPEIISKNIYTIKSPVWRYMNSIYVPSSQHFLFIFIANVTS